jgi:CheY-like chemotaxis protein
MMREEFPIQKSDVHYDPASGEVTLKREKFDAFVKYTQGLLEKIEGTEDVRDLQKYRTRRAERTADVLQALTEDVLKGTAAVREWLGSPTHTISELSVRTGIPYATCHRIVNERLGTPNVEIGHFKKLIAAVSKDRVHVATIGVEPSLPYRRVLLGTSEGFGEEHLVSFLRTEGSEVATVHAGGEVVRKIRELQPDLVLVDVSMPKLGEYVFETLRKFAMNTKSTIILTGETSKSASALLETLSRGRSRADVVADKTGGG